MVMVIGMVMEVVIARLFLPSHYLLLTHQPRCAPIFCESVRFVDVHARELVGKFIAWGTLAWIRLETRGG